MNVYNCFLFNNELDLLDLRLQELYNVTDWFVLVEGNQTFLRQRKPYHFLDNKYRFVDYWGKIIPVQIRDEVIPPTERDGIAYRGYEITQRDAIMRGLIASSDEDVIVITDADEIPRAEIMTELSHGVSGKVRLHFQFHYYSLNTLITGDDGKPRSWNLPVALPYGLLKKSSPTYVRHNFEPGEVVWNNAGWHLSFLGGNEEIRKKLAVHAEYWLNDPKFVSDQNLDKAKKDGLDFASRPGVTMKRYEEVKFLPETIKANRAKYEALGWFQ